MPRINKLLCRLRTLQKIGDKLKETKKFSFGLPEASVTALVIASVSLNKSLDLCRSTRCFSDLVTVRTIVYDVYDGPVNYKLGELAYST